MKALIYVCFILFVADKVAGQTADPLCSNVPNFGFCLGSWNCNENISRCSCFEEQPFCRCNNQVGEFYLDEDCKQKWTIVTFALVASLPGLTLAVLVGVIVYVVMLSTSKSPQSGDVNTATPKGQDLFPGITIASNMNGQPAPNTRPTQQNHIPMITIPNRANSSSVMRDPTMGGPARPYSPSNSMHPYPDRVTDGRPRESYRSPSGGMRDPPMRGPVQPYSNAAGWGQTVNNPYARDAPSRNPYEDRRPYPDQHNDYRPPAPSYSYEDMSQHYSPAPHYNPPERGNSRGGFPRPHLNLQ